MSSPADTRGAAGRRLLPALACVLGTLCISPAESSDTLRVDLGRLEHPAFVIDGLQVVMGAEGAGAKVSALRVAIGGQILTNIELRCAELRMALGEMHCRGGELSLSELGDPVGIDLKLDPARQTAQMSLRLTDAGSVNASLAASGRVTADFADIRVEQVAKHLPQLRAWRPTGRISGRVRYQPDAQGGVEIDVRLVDGAFASVDGLKAAEGVGLDLGVRAQSRSGGWDWQVTSTWSAGEAYLDPLYLRSGMALEAAGRLVSGRLDVNRASLALPGIRAVEANGSFDLPSRRLVHAALAVADADLASIGPLYLIPALAPAWSESLSLSGTMSLGLVIGEGGLSELDLALDALGFSHSESGLSFGPVSGVVPWRKTATTEARLEVGGGRWQKLALGAFEVVAGLSGSAMEIERIEVPVLDGRVIVTDLALRREAAGWRGGGAAVVEPVSVVMLTEALGLPAMSGVLSASLPGVRVLPGEISLEGALVISVFEGYLQATRLHIYEPFGVASRLEADVEARGINLSLLTETFSFGSVSGFIDVDVAGLELVQWRPERFDARVSSSPGSYPKRISQRAVQNIGALGGPGASLAIQRGFLGFFETFGYRRLGLSCVLEHGVCRMGGLGDKVTPGGADGFVIIQGGGVPALNVIGYNRRVDWNELLARLQRVIESNVAPVME